MIELAISFAVLLSAVAGADEHLLAGARAFRAEQYAAALVEFRVAEKMDGSGEAAWYAAATLQKLGRAEDAVEAFAAAARGGPKLHDSLLDYYRALACYDARLYLCADRLLAELDGKSGPRIEEQARRARANIAMLFRDEPGDASIEWYRARASAARATGREALASAYAEEANELTARRKRAGNQR